MAEHLPSNCHSWNVWHRHGYGLLNQCLGVNLLRISDDPRRLRWIPDLNRKRMSSLTGRTQSNGPRTYLSFMCMQFSGVAPPINGDLQSIQQNNQSLGHHVANGRWRRNLSFQKET
jgi:hypothetical protein